MEHASRRCFCSIARNLLLRPVAMPTSLHAHLTQLARSQHDWLRAGLQSLSTLNLKTPLYLDRTGSTPRQASTTSSRPPGGLCGSAPGRRQPLCPTRTASRQSSPSWPPCTPLHSLAGPPRARPLLPHHLRPWLHEVCSPGHPHLSLAISKLSGVFGWSAACLLDADVLLGAMP